MNWGWRIVLLYTGFVSFMLFLVYKCTQQDIDLVTENYYAKELAYGDQYMRMKNSQNPEMKLDLNFDPVSKVMIVTFPQNIAVNNISGEIVFFRPDNKKLDFKIPVKADNAGTQVISCADMTRGLWKMQVSWNSGETGLYEVQNVFVP